MMTKSAKLRVHNAKVQARNETHQAHSSGKAQVHNKAKKLQKMLASLMYGPPPPPHSAILNNYLQISVTSFLSKFPTFTLGKSWLPILYGRGEATLAPLTPGHPSLEAHPSLNRLEIALSETGEGIYFFQFFYTSHNTPKQVPVLFKKNKK